jgi:hypothetical protein
MAYIIKSSSGWLNTRFTDVGRQKLSQGKLDIRYFQIGDSEVSYGAIPNYDQSNNMILEAAYNAQNDTQEPQSNKMNVKYPYYVNGSTGSTYGLVLPEPRIDSIYNTAAPRGFFQTGTTLPWSAKTSSAFTVNSNYTINTCNICNTNGYFLQNSFCSPTTGTPKVGDIAVIYFDGSGSCGTIVNNIPVLTYRIQQVSATTSGTTLRFDRDVPRYYNDTGCCKTARVLIYPSGMTQLYDYNDPMPFWPNDVINFESICDLGNTDVKIWNMNIVWSENPAGINSALNEDYSNFGSREYIGSKEYFGYQSSKGQTFFIDSNMNAETTDSFYYNSFDEIIKVQPEEQKSIAIVHYTNNAIDSFYGEKFAMEPFDPLAQDTMGRARNFKVTIPWLMWHKSKTGTIGETFYVDPNVGQANYFQVRYLQSTKNSDMNEPGLRYFHLWDTHLNDDGNPSRVGKVFPDLKQIVFDDDEIIAALSYKSNRNWTLPAPKLSLLTPDACDNINDDFGLLGDENQVLYVTYRFNSQTFTDSLHSNYYTKITGPQTCYTNQRQDVAIKFGPEFPFMTECCLKGFNTEEFQVLVQTGTTTGRPISSQWKLIDFTDQLSASTSNGFITQSGMTGNTFIIRYNAYVNAPIYNLDNFIDLPQPFPLEKDKLNFGDEYFFYGNIETDIQATIYEMKFLVNLAQTQFTNTSNPTWTVGKPSYITEIGIYDADKDLVVINKLTSPTLRQGSQQFAIKLDF